MTTSAAKAESNRRNAQKSTGPKTKAGKNRVRLNALKHALYAYVGNLPGEDEEQHLAFVQGIHEELQPEGSLEVNIVAQIAERSLELGRLRHAFNEHQAERIERRAVARDNRLLFKLIREEHGNTPAGVQQANATIETILDTADPDPIPPDLNSVLDEAICDEGEARIVADVDRRMRHLMRDIDDGLELLEKLQRRRHAVLLVPLPARSAPDAQGRDGVVNRKTPARRSAPDAQYPVDRLPKTAKRPASKQVSRPEGAADLFFGTDHRAGGTPHQINANRE